MPNMRHSIFKEGKGKSEKAEVKREKAKVERAEEAIALDIPTKVEMSRQKRSEHECTTSSTRIGGNSKRM